LNYYVVQMGRRLYPELRYACSGLLILDAFGVICYPIIRQLDRGDAAQQSRSDDTLLISHYYRIKKVCQFVRFYVIGNFFAREVLYFFVINIKVKEKWKK
jgi:hypothetical protein